MSQKLCELVILVHLGCLFTDMLLKSVLAGQWRQSEGHVKPSHKKQLAYAHICHLHCGAKAVSLV